MSLTAFDFFGVYIKHTLFEHVSVLQVF